MSVLNFDVFWRDHGASRGMKNLGDHTHRTTGRFDKFKGVALGAGIVVGAAIFKLGKDSVKAFSDAEASQTKLQDAFKRFPALTDITIGSLRNLNTQLAQKTKFDDDAFASGQAVLAQFGLTGKQLTAITPLLADYAAKTGKDLPDAAKVLGKAFLGNTRALKEIGINYKMTGDKSKDMAAIQELVNQKVGGFAEKQGKEAAGQAEILSNQFGELEEDVGKGLVPALLALVGVGLDVISFMQRNIKILGPLIGLVVGFAAAVWLVNEAAKAYTAVQAALNIVLSLNPIGLIILALAGLVVGLVIAYKKSETFRKIVDTAFRVVWGIIKAVWDWTKKNWPLLLGILTGPIGLATVLIIRNWRRIWDGLKSLVSTIRNFFQDLPGRIRSWIGAVGRTLYGLGRNLISGFWNGIKSVWSSVITWFKGLPKQILSALGIQSPPQWAIDAGRHIMAGILKGVVPGGQELIRFAKDTVANLQAGFGGGGLLGRILAGGGTGSPGSPRAIGQRMAESVGWGGSQWRALDILWQNESGWNPLADNPHSTAFGIPQFLAGTARQYGVLGSTDAARQIAAGLQYISDVYGNPVNALNAWRHRIPHWYGFGGLASRPALIGVAERGPERVLSPAQTRSFEQLVRVMDRGGGNAAGTPVDEANLARLIGKEVKRAIGNGLNVYMDGRLVGRAQARAADLYARTG